MIECQDNQSKVISKMMKEVMDALRKGNGKAGKDDTFKDVRPLMEEVNKVGQHTHSWFEHYFKTMQGWGLEYMHDDLIEVKKWLELLHKVLLQAATAGSK